MGQSWPLSYSLPFCIPPPNSGTTSGAGPAPLPPGRVDIVTVEAALQQFLEAGLAPSTRKVYTAGWNRYLKFGHTFNACLPVTSEKATLFVAFLGTQGLSLFTIESYLSALRHMRLTLAPSDPCPSLHSLHMALLLREIRRSQAQSGPRLVRLPITPTLMRRIKSTLARHADSYDSILLWAACCVGFFGFLDAGSSWFRTHLLLIRILTCH